MSCPSRTRCTPPSTFQLRRVGARPLVAQGDEKPWRRRLATKRGVAMRRRKGLKKLRNHSTNHILTISDQDFGPLRPFKEFHLGKTQMGRKVQLDGWARPHHPGTLRMAVRGRSAEFHEARRLSLFQSFTPLVKLTWLIPCFLQKSLTLPLCCSKRLNISVQ